MLSFSFLWWNILFLHKESTGAQVLSDNINEINMFLARFKSFSDLLLKTDVHEGKKYKKKNQGKIRKNEKSKRKKIREKGGKRKIKVKMENKKKKGKSRKKGK